MGNVTGTWFTEDTICHGISENRLHKSYSERWLGFAWNLPESCTSKRQNIFVELEAKNGTHYGTRIMLFDKGYISDVRPDVNKGGAILTPPQARSIRTSLDPITFSVRISDKSKSACRAARTRFSEVGTGNSGVAFALGR